MSALTHGFLESRGEFERFLGDWEAGVLPKPEWTHGAHIAMGAAYAVRYGDEAYSRIRAGILNYAEAIGIVQSDTSGYHETLTRFWATVLAEASAGLPDEYTAAKAAVERFAEDREILGRYYSFDVMKSVEARRRWIEPDLIHLGPPSWRSR